MLRRLLEKLTQGNSNASYTWKPEDDGLALYVDKSTTEKIQSGKLSGLLSFQYSLMKMLEEQGQAEQIANGFIIPTKIAVSLDPESQQALHFPERFPGIIHADIQGTTGRSNFSVSLAIETETGERTENYKVIGPILRLSENQQYLLSAAQEHIFSANEKQKRSDKSEYDNLQLMLALQEAQANNAHIRLSHFETLDIKAPNAISLQAEQDTEGNLILTPNMGQNATQEDLERVWGQLRGKNEGALRVGKEIVLLDEKRFQAVEEVLGNRKIPAKQVRNFLKNPTAYLHAECLDLDVGFSYRVKGMTLFKHAYFGEREESGLDWFSAKNSGTTLLPSQNLQQAIAEQQDFAEVEQQLNDTLKAGASEFEYNEHTYDISDISDVKNFLEEAKVIAAQNTFAKGDGEKETSSSKETAVIDVALNDEELDAKAKNFDLASSPALPPLKKPLDWSNYKRQPFPHQVTGVEWIISLIEAGFEGGLLADDMGLGKTFITLASIEQYYRKQKNTVSTCLPSLVIAPLSLLQNWKDEVEKTFIDSPFSSIVILQSQAEMNAFRIGGKEIDQQELSNENSKIRYSLKIGEGFGDKRLDMPGRLVITTYQTLRDYQFSLCAIDWGLVIFDEAQNIKNPNALQTRAAKGLKAEFKAVTTGTPVENSLSDFWCLMDTAYPGYLGTYQDFRAQYVKPLLGKEGEELLKIKLQVGKSLRERVGVLMLRRLKEDNLKGLPEKRMFVGVPHSDWIYKDSLQSVMKGEQQSRYDSIRDNYIRCKEQDKSTNIALATLQALRDVSLHPQLHGGNAIELPLKEKQLLTTLKESGKMDSLLATLEEIKKRQEKCIIFMVNKRLQAFLSAALGSYFSLGPIPIINGDTKAVAKNASVATRKTIIEKFEAQVGFNIIIMSPVAAGVGLTVVGANNIIHYERHWNPAKEAQATDRVYRIGQTKDVNIYIPVLHHPEVDSFDLNLHRLLSNKTSLKDAVVTQDDVRPEI